VGPVGMDIMPMALREAIRVNAPVVSAIPATTSPAGARNSSALTCAKYAGWF